MSAEASSDDSAIMSSKVGDAILVTVDSHTHTTALWGASFNNWKVLLRHQQVVACAAVLECATFELALPPISMLCMLCMFEMGS